MNVDYILSAHGIGGGRRSKDEIPPPPVIGLKAVASGSDLAVTWQNPDDTDFVGVRIVRNVSAYPTSEADGETIYDGTGQTATDVGVLKGQYIYYRAFTYDFDDNYQTDGSQVARGIVKADQAAPAKPTLKEITHDVVTLEPTPDHEYSLNATTWQMSNVFEGLNPDTPYTFYQRKVGTELLNPSPASEGLAVTTLQTPFLYTAIIDTTNSNPETSVTYADDAIGLTPGSAIFDEKFGHYPVMLKGGVEGKKLNPNDYTKHTDGTTADITSGAEGDVMVAIPRLGYKVETVGNNLHVSVTDEPNKVGFSYKAHTRGSASRDVIYVGAYLGFNQNGKLRSISGKEPTPSQALGVFRDQAQANGSGYELLGFYQLTLIQCMYIIKYKNLDSQTAVGTGFVTRNNASITTGGANAKGMDFGETTGKQQMKLFGIEDFWGNLFYWIDGLRSDANWDLLITTDNFGGADSTYTKYDTTVSANVNGYLTKAQGDNNKGFIAQEVGGSQTTYYCDAGVLLASRFPYFGGYWESGLGTGAFNLAVSAVAFRAVPGLGGRLMYL